MNRERKERRGQQTLERVTSNILANMMNEERITPKGNPDRPGPNQSGENKADQKPDLERGLGTRRHEVKEEMKMKKIGNPRRQFKADCHSDR